MRFCKGVLVRLHNLLSTAMVPTMADEAYQTIRLEAASQQGETED